MIEKFKESIINFIRLMVSNGYTIIKMRGYDLGKDDNYILKDIFHSEHWLTKDDELHVLNEKVLNFYLKNFNCIEIDPVDQNHSVKFYLGD